MRKRITLGGIALAVALLSACGTAQQITPHVPSSTSSASTSAIGRALAAFNYMPVYDQGNGAYIFVATCPKTNGNIDLSACSSNLYNEGSLNRPNVYVHGETVYMLEGPHDSTNDDRSIWSSVPASYQDFANLTAAQQQQLLTQLMPAIKPILGVPGTPKITSIDVSGIGQVKAIVSRFTPNLQ